MATFIDEIRERLAEAQQRLQEVTRRLQLAQMEHQSVGAEVASYQKILEVETRKLQIKQVAHARQNLVASAAAGVAGAIATLTAPAVRMAEAAQRESDANKTDAIRDAIRQHPGGMTPAQIWQVVKDQVANRNYVYSVLSRLKERREVVERRGKYFIQVSQKPEEVANSPVQ